MAGREGAENRSDVFGKLSKTTLSGTTRGRVVSVDGGVERNVGFAGAQKGVGDLLKKKKKKNAY